MKIIFLFLSIMFVSGAAFAKVTVRAPILIKNHETGERFAPSQLKQEMKAAGLKLPDYVVIEAPEDQEIIIEYADQIEDANISTPEGNAYESVRWGDLNDYTGDDLKYPLCYTSNNKNLNKATREAFEFWASLSSYGLLSDQYTMHAFRFYDQDQLHLYDYNGDDYDGGVVQEEEDVEFFSEFMDIKVKKGEILILSTTSDGGDNPHSEVLSPCK